MNFFRPIFLLMILPVIFGCDLQPKVMNLPDTIGGFISARYPALLADPNAQPEIYNSAASDYGVYAAPELYGVESASTNDYVLYANVSDYVMPEQAVRSLNPNENNENVLKADNTYGDYLVVPMYGTYTGSDDIKIEPKTVSIPVQEITVAAGDTLYSVSRKYQIPVNDLAVMNDLQSPFNLSVGQKLRVPVSSPIKSVVVTSVVETQTASTAEVKKNTTVTNKTSAAQTKTETKPVEKTSTKISSDPTKKLPAIAARSSSRFTWPVRGRVVSEYGAKSNGLFNDGINIAATRGTAVGAAENGVVAYAGNEVKGMGNLVIIQHTDGWMTVYAHMDSMVVKRGSKVSVGQKIGTVGTTGKVDEPQLHFEIRKGTNAYNPISYLKKL